MEFAMEDRFLNLDNFNYNSEWECMVNNDCFNLSEIVDLFKNGQITAENYMYAIEYLEDEL